LHIQVDDKLPLFGHWRALVAAAPGLLVPFAFGPLRCRSCIANDKMNWFTENFFDKYFLTH
jgi:hypothetical protein